MKISMINDCAFVGKTILKYLPEEGIKKVYIERSKKLWSKTFGVFFKILMSKADIYHANYLLQDCYIALKLGKRPLLGHAHGSDLRLGLTHPLWKNIVLYNLKNSDKILVSTPDILELARSYREDAEYIPNPVDIQIFYPKPLSEKREKLMVLIASDSNWTVKGTDIVIKALSKIKEQVYVSIIGYGRDLEKTLRLARSLGLNIHVLPKTSHKKIREYYWKHDVVIDRFKLGSLGMISLEAIACGRPVVTYVSSKYPEYNSFPLKDISTEEKIIEAVSNTTSNLWKRQYDYLRKNHDPYKIVNRLIDIYKKLIIKN